MSPQVKKLVSAIAVAVAGAVLVTLNAYVIHLPAIYQGLAGAFLAACAHYVDAYGHAERVEQQVDAEVKVKLASIRPRALESDVDL